MTNEQLRMQMLSGIITEGEYKTKLEENKDIINAKQNGDKSYTVEYNDGTTEEIYVSDDAWDEINNKYGMNESKDSLNEHYVAGGIVGIGAITQIPPRAKTDYEMAFEHFLGERYENREQDLEEGEEEEDLDEGKEVEEPENY